MESATKSKSVAYFLSFVGPDYSRSSTLLNFKSTYIEKKYMQISSNLFKLTLELIKLRKSLHKDALIVIMSPAHKVTLLAKLITGKKIILDAGWPLTDGVLSRGLRISKLPELGKLFLLDLISFQAADKILVESFRQLHRVNRMFLVPKGKLRVSYTGMNESAFEERETDSAKILELKSQLKLTPKPINVLFRGKVNKESGITTIISSAKDLCKEANFIFLTGKNNDLVGLSSNCFQVSDVTQSEMAQIYELADVALGQISNHPRLKYTIPHKAFEAAFFGKCYLTPRSQGVSEIFNQDECYFLNNVSVSDLVSSIRLLVDSSIRKTYEYNISKTYEKRISQRAINSSFENLLRLYSK